MIWLFRSLYFHFSTKKCNSFVQNYEVATTQNTANNKKMQSFISSIENHTKNLDVLMILNIKKSDKNITSTVTTTAKFTTTTISTATKSTTTITQNNTNKSEYAFKKSLNSLLSCLIGAESRQPEPELSKEAKEALSEAYQQLRRVLDEPEQKPLLLQSINESEQQSGIVSDILLTVKSNSTIRKRAATTTPNIDCIAFVVIGVQKQQQQQKQERDRLAGQYYALSELEPETGKTGCYNVTKDGNLTHFNHLIKITMNDNDTVNMICDLIEYLITVNTNHSIIIDACSSLICNDQNLDTKDNNNDIAMANVATDANTSEQAKRTSKLVTTTYVKFDDLLRMSEWEKTVQRSGAKLPRMRLCGGGEDSINNGTSAWGTPGTGNPGNSWGGINPQQPPAWGAGAPGQAGPGVPGTSAGGKPQPPPAAGGPGTPGVENAEGGNAWAAGNPVNPANNSGGAANPAGAAGASGSASNASNSANPNQPQQPAAQPQADAPATTPNPKLERLNTMIEALHALDGWGSENVNQDIRWDVPASPEPGSKPDPNSAVTGPTAGIPMWKTNTGTEIWEANLRNGGQMPQQQPVQKTPWGPTTNHGGVWGEDDDSGDQANVWNGASGGNPAAGTPQGGPSQQPPWNAGGAGGGMWGPGGVAPGAIKKENDWGGNAGGPAASWDQRNMPTGGAPGAAGGMEPTNIDMRNIRISGGMDGNREIRGDPRGISGRLNGNVNLWEQHQMPGMAPNKIPQVTTPVTPSGAGGPWPNNQLPGHNKMPSGWEEPSTQGVRRNVDDGTAVWGQNTLSRQNSNVSNWKEGSEGPSRNSVQRNSIVGGNLPGGPISARLGNSGPIKPDNLWGQNNVGGGRGAGGAGWGDDAGGNSWEEKNTGSLWNENPSAGAGWNKQGKQMGGNNWNDVNGGDMGSEWGMPGGGMNKPPSKMNPLEYIRSSKQFRILCEGGFKKEDVETALRICNMNLEEAIEMLQRNGSGGGDWRRPDDHGPGFGNQFGGDRFSAGGNSSLPFPGQVRLVARLEVIYWV